MHILLHDESDLTVSQFDKPGFEVEVEKDVHAHYSALQMFASSLGLCTASVLISYGEQLDASTEGLEVRVRWTYADEPYRVDDIDMEINWPDLPDSRLQAAERAAEQCTTHNTLHHPPHVDTNVQN